MVQNVTYHCPHLDTPRPPLAPSFASSSADLSELPSLYFCEECDAIRCSECISVEVASYYCPNCLFDVPTANVRADKNSHEIGWLFEKPSSLASQAVNVYPIPEEEQAEFDQLKDHLENYIQDTPSVNPKTGHSRRVPTRHIGKITQAAARALGRDVPGSPLARPKRRVAGDDKGRAGWDELGKYEAKHAWRSDEQGNGGSDIDALREMTGEDITPLDKRWEGAWAVPSTAKDAVPERIPLQAKLTKRCPSPTCRHILIQPDTKSVRMLIKMVASNYLPALELGRRRHRRGETVPAGMTEEDMERRRKDRRRARLAPGQEADQDMREPLKAGEVLAFTNPLYDPIQIRLSAPYQKHSIPPNHLIHIPTAHFTVGALKETFAYDDEDDDDSGGEDEFDDRKRLSLTRSTRAHPGASDVEKRGNVSKVGLELEVLPSAEEGPVEQFDLEVRFTYRADDAEGAKDKEPEYKTFTFWTRVHAGGVVPDYE
ncbi:hypothetical protein A1Q2_02111 [Trichosporon asahii var. asahii CBS 8904]|uniref:Dynactin subunit 4 n=1 Tax=Trichosporon asahii var. asahii (strain CBS 8904) TaxID=1220162 RepID=K1W3Q8_TRIAC|nr:hypothetical protein A1Q2_02111 [Trichosporon asahii var. asahii CBS 8904]